MYSYPPPLPAHGDKSFASTVSASVVAASEAHHHQHQQHLHHLQLQQHAGTPASDRFLPSLLHTPASAPPPPSQQLQQNGQHPPLPHNYPLNNILLQTAQFMAMNEQLRKEIEQYANLRVHAASLAGGPEAQVAAAAAAAYFLSPPIVGAHVTSGSAEQQQQQTAAPPPSLVGAPFGSVLLNGGARLPPMAPPPGRKSPMPDSYKTVMCQAWLEASMCSFGENCRFAHGEHELRPMTQPQRANRKYKTKLCEKYTNTGLCPYGTRCLFIHPDSSGSGGSAASAANSGPNSAYIRPDKLEELKKRQQNERGDESATSAATTAKLQLQQNLPQKGSEESRELTSVKQSPAPSLMAEGKQQLLLQGCGLSSDAVNVGGRRRGGASSVALPFLPPMLSSMMHHHNQRTSTPLMGGGGGVMQQMNNTGKPPVAPMMSIGITPIRPRQSLRPHPSWPLEPSHFFDRIGGEDEEEDLEEYEDDEQRELMQAAEAVSAGAAAAVLMNCGTSTDGRSLRGSCSSYSSQPPTAPDRSLQHQLQHDDMSFAAAAMLPRAVSPVIGGFEHLAALPDVSTSGSPVSLLECSTPCSGLGGEGGCGSGDGSCGSSSGYLSESGGGGGAMGKGGIHHHHHHHHRGGVTPASGLSSGSASPLDALMLSGGGSMSMASSPPSMLLDSLDSLSAHLFHETSLPLHPSSAALLPPGGNMSISLPPMTSSGGGCWGVDPFNVATFDIDRMAREMAKEYGGGI